MENFENSRWRTTTILNVVFLCISAKNQPTRIGMQMQILILKNDHVKKNKNIANP